MRFALFLVFSNLVFAQSVEVGVEGGVPVTNVYTAYTIDSTGAFGKCAECATQRRLPYVIGPAVQIHFWRMLFLDAKGLYSRVDYTHSGSGGDGHTLVDLKAVDRWEVPILLKAQLNSWHVVHPYVAGGVSFEYSQGFFQPKTVLGVVGTFGPNAGIGSTFALGASFGSRRVRPSLEVRYTRWSERPPPGHQITIEPTKDELEVVAGVMFGAGGSRPDSAGVLEGPLGSRRVSLGIEGGLLLTDPLLGSSPGAVGPPFGTCFECGTVRNLRYVVGPAVDVRIAGPLSFTAEELYSRADYFHTSVTAQMFSRPGSGYQLLEQKDTVDRWETPLLLKYSFKMRGFTPFISAGASIQYDRDRGVRFYGDFRFTQTPGDFVQFSTSSTLQGGSVEAGPTAGIGTSFDAGCRIRPSIEVRFTHWADRAISVLPPNQFPMPAYAGTPTIMSARNQVQLLVGLMF